MPTEFKIAIARLETIRNTNDSLIGELCETIIDIVQYINTPTEGIGFIHEKTK